MMICAYCRRPITRAAIAAGHYNRSKHTGNHYCLRADCLTVGKRLIKKEARAHATAGH